MSESNDIRMACHVYIAHLLDGSLYVGVTNDPIRRHLEHVSRHGSRFTGMAGGGEIVFAEEHVNRDAALKREKQLKGWTRAKKLALIKGEFDRLKALARSKGYRMRGC